MMRFGFVVVWLLLRCCCTVSPVPSERRKAPNIAASVLGGSLREVIQARECLRRTRTSQEDPSTSRLEVISVLIPKTGSRHFNDILDEEYRHAVSDDALSTDSKTTTRRSTRSSPDCRSRHISWHARPYSKRVVEAFRENEDLLPQACAEIAMEENLHAAYVWKQTMEDAGRVGVPLLTMLRDPVDYVLSYFSHDHRTLRPADIRNRRGDWIRDWMDFVNGTEFSANMQVGFLSGKRLNLFSPADRESVAVRRGRDVCRLRHSAPVTEEDLASVERMLASGALLAGVTEHMRASVQQFSRRLRWSNFNVTEYGEQVGYNPRTKEYFASINSGKDGDSNSKGKLRREDLPQSLISLIQSRSSLDMRLHRWLSQELSALEGVRHVEDPPHDQKTEL